MVYSNILEAVGHTPMVRLNRMVPAGSADVLVKFEGLNVGGSIKTRTALNMLEDAERRGLLHPDTIIVEPTSGNQGIGLALCGAVTLLWRAMGERRCFPHGLPACPTRPHITRCGVCGKICSQN